MNKFTEKLKHLRQGATEPMGFRTQSTKEKRKIMVIASISEPNIDNLKDYIGGADALLYPVNNISDFDALSRLAKETPEMAFGARLTDTLGDKEKFLDINCDFVLFKPEMPFYEWPEGTGRVLELNLSDSDSMTRSVNDLKVDAVMIYELSSRILNWRYLNAIQRIDNLISKPIMVQFPADTSIDTLSQFWEVGADALVVDIISGKQKDIIGQLREAVDKTGFPAFTKSKKTDVTLPFISPEQSEDLEEEERL